MIKVYQTEFFNPEEGTRGNCLRAAVASLLHKKLLEVPPFYPDENQQKEFIDYIESIGYIFDGCVYVKNIYELERHTADKLLLQQLKDHRGIDGYFLVCGMSPRGVRHAVIYNHQGLAHDPHPSRDGVFPEYAYLIGTEIDKNDEENLFSHG